MTNPMNPELAQAAHDAFKRCGVETMLARILENPDLYTEQIHTIAVVARTAMSELRHRLWEAKEQQEHCENDLVSIEKDRDGFFTSATVSLP
jgi:excinuclease UvrABC ATPase subunit